MGDLQKNIYELLDLYQDVKNEIRRTEPDFYELWKAGGFLIDPDIISMYPCLEKILDRLNGDEDEDYEGDE